MNNVENKAITIFGSTGAIIKSIISANNEQQKDLAALAICGNNLEAIDVLQRLHQYCLNIGDLPSAALAEMQFRAISKDNAIFFISG